MYHLPLDIRIEGLFNARATLYLQLQDAERLCMLRCVRVAGGWIVPEHLLSELATEEGVKEGMGRAEGFLEAL